MKKFLILLGILLIPCGVFAQTIGGGGSTSPGGTTGQTQFNNGGNFGGFTLAGDCSLAQPTITCTATNGTAFTSAATTTIGTSGAVLGLLNGNLTFGGNDTFSGTLTAGSLSTVGTVGGSICRTAAGLLLYESGINCFAATAGTVTTTGTPANGNLTAFSGASTITNSNLSGDITTTGTLATTLATVNSNVGTFQGITVNAKGLTTAAGPGQVGLGNSFLTQLEPNSATGTGTNLFAKLVAGQAQTLATTDTASANVIGVCTANCTNTGNATVAVSGTVSCVFDGATTAGDYVIASVTTGGQCHDATAVLPTGVTVFGFVQTTNGGAGTYSVDINQVGVLAANTSAKSNFITAAFTMTNFGGL
jgi:hypothetical protein